MTRQALGNSDVVTRGATAPEGAAPGPTGDEMNPNPFLHPQEQKT